MGEQANTREWRGAEIPSSNGHGNARSIAQIGSIFASGGQYNGSQILSRQTIEHALEPQIGGRDDILMNKTTFGLGFVLYSFLGGRTFEWGGAGGFQCIMDIDQQVSFGYAMNNIVKLIGKNKRVIRLRTALQKCMESL